MVKKVEAGYLSALNEKILRERIPVTGTVDLTRRCNLRCGHCYLAAERDRPDAGRRELGTERWLEIVDEICAAGCLNLLITGGEPLLRRDFAAFYRRAKERGLLVTVFTNGTLVDDGIADLFADLPPQAVEISLYGATAAVADEVTGVPGSHERCVRGIEALLARGVKVTLKTMLLAGNRDEWREIEGRARAYGVDFRLDGAVFPCLDGGKAPLDHRVTPEEVVAMELGDPERARKWKGWFEKMKGVEGGDGLYTCGAGSTLFHIDPDGALRPCLMVRGLSHGLGEGTFREGWEKVLSRLGEKRAAAGYRCNECEKRSVCGLCPAFFELESGAADVPASYLCELGELRYRALRGETTFA